MAEILAAAGVSTLVEVVLALASLLAGVLVLLLASALVDVLAPVCVEVLATVAIEPLTIPVVSTVILWSQLGGLAVAAVARVAVGVKEIVLDPKPSGPSFSGWLVKTILSIAGVALMPTFCNMVIELGTSMFATVQGWTSSSIALEGNPIEFSDLSALAELGLDGVLAVIVSSAIAIMVAYNAVTIAVDLVKRQVIMLVVSVTATWVSVRASFDAADSYLDILVSLFFLCITQWVQYLFFAIAIVYLNDVANGSSFALVDVTEASGMWNVVLVVALLGAAREVPEIIERYSFSVGRSGVGNMLVGQAVRGGVGALTGMPARTARVVSAGGRVAESSARSLAKSAGK